MDNILIGHSPMDRACICSRCCANRLRDCLVLLLLLFAYVMGYVLESHLAAASSVPCSAYRPPSNFVRGQASTIEFAIENLVILTHYKQSNENVGEVSQKSWFQLMRRPDCLNTQSLTTSSMRMAQPSTALPDGLQVLFGKIYQ